MFSFIFQWGGGGGGGGREFVCGAIRPVQFIFVDRFFITLMAEELFLLNQGNSLCHVQLKTTWNYNIYR